MKRYNTLVSVHTLKLNMLQRSTDILQQLRRLTEIVKEIIKRFVTSNAGSESLVGMYVRSSPNLEEAIWIAPRPPSQISLRHVLTIIHSITQSAHEWLLENDEVNVEVFNINLPSGDGSKCQLSLENYENLKRKKCLVSPPMDGICLLRAIVIGIAFLEGDKIEYRKIIRNKTYQTLKAQEFGKKIGLKNVDRIATPLGMRVIKLAQKYLTHYRIVLISRSFENRIVFDGKNKKTPFVIYEGIVQQVDGTVGFKHYFYVKSIKAFFCRSYFCWQCLKSYSNLHAHSRKCEENKFCFYCFSKTCKREYNEERYCLDCNRLFPSSACFKTHKETICGKIVKCFSCNQFIRGRNKVDMHKCNTNFCLNCKANHSTDDWCYLKKYSPKSTVRKRISCMCFFDCETVTDDQGFHKVITLCSQTVCSECKSKDLESLETNSVCKHCQHRTRFFESDPMREFLSYVFSLTNIFSVITLVAHNFSSFDGILLISTLFEMGHTPNCIILNGRSIKYMTIGKKIRCIDTLAFIPIKLSAFPETFDIQGGMRKSFFPYKFANTLQSSNYQYRGPIPEKKWFEPERKNEAELLEFESWYSMKSKDPVYDFKGELRTYNILDTQILRIGALKFDQSFYELSGFSALENCVSISSASMMYFRKCFLKEKSIILTSSTVFKKQYIYSKESLLWLSYIQKTRNIPNMISATVGEEQRIPSTGYTIDGYVENQREDGKVERVGYDFLGCFYHGHECQTSDREKKRASLNYKSLNTKRSELAERDLVYKRYLTKVESIWECEFKELKSTDPFFKNYERNVDIWSVLPIEPRAAYLGGRTETLVMVRVPENNEKIFYFDFVGLYSYVLKNKRFMVGTPQFITQFKGDEDVSSYFGLIKASISPPRGLFVPVLPMKINNKLMFGLCNKCMQTCQQTACEHNEKERMFHSTWTTVEVLHALNRGYRIHKIHQVVHFPDSMQYDKNTNSEGLFSTFVNSLMKRRLEVSGWPKNVTDERGKDAYIQEVFEKESIVLDKSKICQNSSLKNVCKRMLNSFYGQLGLRDDYKNTVIVKTPEEYVRILTDPQKHITGLTFPNEQCAIISYEELNKSATQFKGNPILSSFITAYGRLMLLNVIEQLVEEFGERSVLYFDTDSVIFCADRVPTCIKEGTLLGEMTNEFESCDHSASLFLSGGPKSYGMQIINHVTKEPSHSIIKIRGFRLASQQSGSATLNPETLLDLLLSYQNDPQECKEISVNQTQFLKNKYFRVQTVDNVKKFKIKFDKRVVDRSDISKSTLPYGY
jgi:DNA polymerase family B